MPRRQLSSTVLVVPSLFVLLALAAAPAAAQQEGGSYDRIAETNSTVAYFYHARAGVPTIQISVWGTIPRPGIYEVSDATNLDRLLTMAGGAPAEPRVEGRERAITIRLFRQQASQREMIYEAPLEELLRDTGSYPDLQDGDVLIVETRIDDTLQWQEVLGVVSSIGSLALLAERLFRRL